MSVMPYKGILGWFWSWIRHYDHEKYWNMREYVATHNGGLKCYWYLYRIKRMDAFNNASTGTHPNNCAKFATRPYLPHGLNGIIISNEASFGKECIIYHQITVGGGNG